MFQHDNFITFVDLSPEGRFLWLSPAVYDVLGYTPDELVGVAAYDLANVEDIVQTRVSHKENLLNDLVASQSTVRFRAKDGHYVPCVSVYSLCYDFMVACVTMIHPDPGSYSQLRSHSTAMTQLVGSKKEEFERIKRHQKAFTSNRWDARGMEPELRVCMILNRFSRNLIIMYASSTCERVFHIDPDDIVGKPILLFIRADDLASCVEQMNVVKASTALMHMRFWFQSPRSRQEIPCEAMLFGAADGIVAVIRRCRPFIRKRFIGSSDHYQTLAANNKNRSHSSSWTSASSMSPSSVTSSASYLSMSRISRIRILDLDQNSNVDNTSEDNSSNSSSSAHITRSKTRPLTVPKDDPQLIKDGLDLTERFGIKVYNVQDYVEEQDGDDDSGDDIDDCGIDSDSRSNMRQELDTDMDPAIN
ncbi:hypothetical protein BGZ99_001045 [Dissophora globulifera]|uniref:PAS domain-containing protein n=1 Tax=Dissophora globulifera TaxID=979702 RepID=A0A9P6RP81_9FUNG|nr:hypothetical protein BGZ99_001045 [Dissophora globulifera]